MTTMLVEVEIYVEDTGLSKALTIEGDDMYTAMYLGKRESCEIADRLEAIVGRGCNEPYELHDGLDKVAIEKCGYREVRIYLNGVRGVLDPQAAREIAHDLRAGWEGGE